MFVIINKSLLVLVLTSVKLILATIRSYLMKSEELDHLSKRCQNVIIYS